MPISTRNDAHLSVLDCRRSELNRRHDGTGSYTFNVRVPKVEFSLGWELEANHGAVRTPSGVVVSSDGSVNGDSIEYIVMPTLVKSVTYVLGLLKDLVHAPELNTDKSCGFHVHIAPKNVTLKQMRLWAITCEMLAKRIEDKAFEAVPDARQSNNYCRRIQPTLLGTRFVSNKYSNDRRYHWLNLVEMFRPSGIRTVEIRLLGNTHRWKYLAAWSYFCLALGNEAWKAMYSPFNIEGNVSYLNSILNRIITEIKPLEKRSEPVPLWVYQGLESLGVKCDSWNRPLAKLRDAELELKGMRKVFYSDAQATIESSNDEDENSGCACGCGDDERCSYQIHVDENCQNEDCEHCHDNGNCSGMGDCYYCRQEARRQESARISNIVVIQEQLNSVRSRVLDNYSMTINHTTASLLFSTVENPNNWVEQEGQVLPITANELSASEQRERRHFTAQPLVEPTMETERQAYMMLDNHEEALSLNREHNQGGW